ncbi:MAG: hypothetical protein ACRDQG_08425, partial [Pseudonocardiaceae bacterium]
ARLVIVPGERFGVLDELLERHASLVDAVFEQCPCWPIDHVTSWAGRPCGGGMAGLRRFADTTSSARLFQLAT